MCRHWCLCRGRRCLCRGRRCLRRCCRCLRRCCRCLRLRGDWHLCWGGSLGWQGRTHHLRWQGWCLSRNFRSRLWRLSYHNFLSRLWCFCRDHSRASCANQARIERQIWGWREGWGRRIGGLTRQGGMGWRLRVGWLGRGLYCHRPVLFIGGRFSIQATKEVCTSHAQHKQQHEPEQNKHHHRAPRTRGVLHGGD